MFHINDFSGGLNARGAPMQIHDNQAVDLLNCEFDLTGALVKRNGYTAYNASPISGAGLIDNLIRYCKNDGSRILLATTNSAAGNRLFAGNDATGTFTEITGGSTLEKDRPVDMLVYRDTLFLSNGSQPIQFYAGGATKADATGSPAPPTGSCLAVCDNRLFVAGNSAAPNRLFFSGIALFSSLPAVDFPADNFIDIPKQDTGDRITALAAYRDELFVFRRNDIWALLGSGPEDYYLQEVNNRVGALSHRAVCNTGDALVFACAGGVREFRDGVMHDTGRPVDPIVNTLHWGRARACWYPKRRQVWFCAGTTAAANDRVLVYDTALKAWTVFDLRLNALCVFPGEGDTGELYGGSPTNGAVWRLDDGASDNGADIAFSYSTKHFDMRMPQNAKIFRRLFFNVNTPLDQGAFRAEVSVDSGRVRQSIGDPRFKGFNRWGNFVYGQAPYGGGLLQTAAAPLNTGMAGRYINLTISNSGQNPLTVFSIGIQHKPKPLRGE
jgi:hypothetical protein